MIITIHNGEKGFILNHFLLIRLKNVKLRVVFIQNYLISIIETNMQTTIVNILILKGYKH